MLAWGQGYMETVLPAQFCYERTTALKKEILLKMKPQKTEQFNQKMGKRHELTFHQKVYRWQINTQKDVQHH